MFGIGKPPEKVLHGEGMVLVPAAALVEFLELNSRDGLSIRYFECLYKVGVGTRPSMELSAAAKEFPSWAEFTAFATDAAAKALAVASNENSIAAFEVGFDQRLTRTKAAA